MLDLEPAAKEALQGLSEYFRGGEEHTDPERADARLRITFISAYTRLEQTKRAGQALEVSLAQTLLDQGQLGQYVNASMPESPLARLLPTPA